MTDLSELLRDSLFILFGSPVTHLAQTHLDVRMGVIWSVKAEGR